MWVLLEGKPNPIKIRADENNYSSGTFIVDDLKEILKEEFNELQNIGRSDIECFLDDKPLDSDLVLTNDNTTAKNPLVVRYPLSNLKSKMLSYIFISYNV